VLLADDNADMRDYVRHLLAGQYEVRTAPDGRAACAAALAEPPDLILADVMMPGLDGFALLRQIRQDARTREVPVILLSARAGEESRVEGLEAGADDYLVKPFSARELLARVQAHLGLAKLRREAREALLHSEEALRAQNERLKLLWEAAGVLLSTDEPDAMLQELFAKIRGSMGLDVYFNYMLEDTGEALRLVSCAGVPEETARSISRLHLGQAVCGTVARLHRPLHKRCIQDSAEPMVQLVRGLGVRAYACNPLLAGDRLLGTLSFASRTRDQFDPEEIEFLETISHYVTIAYERLRLIEQLREADDGAAA
jgi:DNA-binding response OmpR family regulator